MKIQKKKKKKKYDIRHSSKYLIPKCNQFYYIRLKFGDYKDLRILKEIHLMACKRFLGVQFRTPNTMVYGDLGRFPLFINSYLKSIKSWLRLLEMGIDRLPKAACKMLLCLDRNGKDCWASRILRKFCVKLDSTLYGCSRGWVTKSPF